MGSIEIRADRAKNRLYIAMRDFITTAEAKAAADLTINEAKSLKAGFSVINDISTFKPTTSEGLEEVKRAQAFLKQHGVGRVIRILDAPSLSASQMQRKSAEVGYKADTAGTIEEAERLLGD